MPSVEASAVPEPWMTVLVRSGPVPFTLGIVTVGDLPNAPLTVTD